tara:strand:- start:6017 stop:7513 length:1497 start_codon:yes stop_codon:yes gene_type:complete
MSTAPRFAQPSTRHFASLPTTLHAESTKDDVLKLHKVTILSLLAFISGCQTLPDVAAPSSNFDGRYSFRHHCHDDEELSAKLDGSTFIISGGIITNNLGGAGRYKLQDNAKVDAKGNLAIAGTRKTSEFAIYGNLLDRKDKFSISSRTRTISGELTGHITHNQSRHPCVAQFERIGDAPNSAPNSAETATNDKNTVQVRSKNTTTEIDLLADEGEKVLVDVEFQNLQDISAKGLAIIVPSSTPNMEDEAHYAERMREFGLATAVIHGAAPRFTAKFSARYTSSMIVRDLIATLTLVNEKLPKPKQIIVMGSSAGAYGIFKVAWEKLRASHPQLTKIDKAIMVNALCPERFESGWQTDVALYTANGRDDDSTTAASCAALKKTRSLPNLRRLTYSGAHHFESPRFGPTQQVDGMHIIPTCSLNINERLFTTISRRDGSDSWETETKGSGDKLYNWLGKTCVRRGHKQGYDPEGGPMFWSDVKLIVDESTPPSNLQGLTQ